MVSEERPTRTSNEGPYKTKFNSFVAPGPKHTFQVDLFNFRYEQEVNFKKNPPPPHGLLCVDVFTKKVHVVPLQDKTAASWRDALDKLVDKMGRPLNIMTDPDASITSIEIDEWFRRNKDIKHIMTRRHAAFAERSLREFKQNMYKKIRNEVKPWPEYLNEVLQRMNTGKQSDDADDDKVYPHRATGMSPEEGEKPENWFEARNNMEIQAKREREYPELKVGDKVEVYRQKSALAKEVVGDYKYNAAVITNITRSNGQTFYKVEGEGKPLLRSDILLFKESAPEEAPQQQQEPREGEGEGEPYMSYKRKRIVAREKNKELRENKARLAAEQKEAVRKAKEDAKAAVTETKNRMAAEAKASKADWGDFARGIRERAKLRQGG